MASPFSIALSHFLPFGSRTYVRLFQAFHGSEQIWQATTNELIACGIKEKLAQEFVAWRQTVNPDFLTDTVVRAGLQTIERFDDRYPELLNTIHDPPLLLYVKGTLPSTKRAIALVGSRKATPYGINVAKQLAQELATAGVTVVSGLAYGIDDAAHRGALEAGGKTIAVVACGLQQLPQSRRELVARIVDHGGALLSEYPPHVSADKFRFPIRNRIIAGLSQGTVIVEAGLPSGSLITAQVALNESRDVFAVPGPINIPTSRGTNQLLKDGAHLVMETEDILSFYGVRQPAGSSVSVPEPSNSTEASIMKALSSDPKHVDEVTRACHLKTPALLSALTIMEIHGKVRHLGNMYYSLP